MQELIYTSAPKGLRLGSRGFCTVACTPGMAEPLAARLEALSGYKHLYPPGSQNAHLNPVNYSYVTFKFGGKTYYVLSRIADAGLDYTQRSNKLAHHVVLEGSELPPGGPAWLMSQPDFFVTKWEGEPRVLEPRQLPSSMTPQLKICHAWQAAAGDAGWAGILAESLDNSDSAEANVVFLAGTELLSLVQESQSLLAPQKRWGATFSTYYSKLPPGTECRWRFIPDGTPESIVAARSHGTLLVNLSAQQTLSKHSDLIAAARSGNRQTAKVAPAIAIVVAPRTQPDAASIPQIQIPALESQPELELVPRLGPPQLPRRKSLGRSLPSDNDPAESRWQRTALVVFAAFAIGAIITGGVLAWRHHDVIRKSPDSRVATGFINENPEFGDGKVDAPESTQDPAPNRAPPRNPRDDATTGGPDVNAGNAGATSDGVESAIPQPTLPPNSTAQTPSIGETRAAPNTENGVPVTVAPLVPADMLVDVLLFVVVEKPLSFGADAGPFTIASFRDTDSLHRLTIRIVGGDGATIATKIPANQGDLPKWQILREGKELAVLNTRLDGTESKILQFAWAENVEVGQRGVDALLASALEISAKGAGNARLCILHPKGHVLFKEDTAIVIRQLPSKFKEVNLFLAKIPAYQPLRIRCQILAFEKVYEGELDDSEATYANRVWPSRDIEIGNNVVARMTLLRTEESSVRRLQFKFLARAGVAQLVEIDKGLQILMEQLRTQLMAFLDISPRTPESLISYVDAWATNRAEYKRTWQRIASSENDSRKFEAQRKIEQIEKIDGLIASLKEMEQFKPRAQSDVEVRLRVERRLGGSPDSGQAHYVTALEMGTTDDVTGD